MATSSEPETTSAASEAIERLAAAWRGEIQARAIYTILARREKDPQRAEIIRQIADGEASHRERIEARLIELGQKIPDPSEVKVPFWLSLQAKVAPPERVIAHMESAEQEEITDRYKRPTGDPATDVVLASIRTEEQKHSVQLQAMQSAHPVSARALGGRPGVESRLERILGRESWHRTGSGWISGAIYGANDGLAAVFGIVAGVSGATGGGSFVLTAGLFGAVASALSMATGAFLAERSEAEVGAANLARERREIEDNPDEEREELSLFYQLKGLSKKEADLLALKLSEDPEAMLGVMAMEELEGATGGSGKPTQAALAAGISTFFGAMIPVIPFFFLRGFTAVVVAAIVSLAAHFLVGASKALFTLRTWYGAGLEMTIAGVIVGGITYGSGLLLQGHTG